MERNVVPIREFFDLLRSGLDILFAVSRLGQDHDSVAVCRHLLKDSKGLGFRVAKRSDGKIATRQAYVILNVIGIKFTRFFQKRRGLKRRRIVLPHCSDSLECECVLRIQTKNV